MYKWKTAIISLLFLTFIGAAGAQDIVSQRHRATRYHNKFENRKTSSGERFSQKKYTAAHHNIKLGTYVLVVDTITNKWVIVKVNDRCPRRNVIDLAAIAAESEKPVLLVCDRGTMDISVYLSPETWQAITQEVDIPIDKLRDSRYDAVLHLVTAADGAAEFYTTSNNEARTEGVDLACSLDKKLRSAWTGHPHLRVISNSENFENKIRRVLREISNVLGIPAPIENERKFMVEVVGEIPNAIETDIVQTYLMSEPGTVVRLRKRMMQGKYVYLQTTTKTVGDNERIVTERNISYNQYMSMMALADPTRQSIHKIRKSFIWEGQYYELDQFIDPDPGFSILEMDSETKGEETKFPPFIKVIKDVTGKVKYYNINLAVKTLYD